MLLDGRQLPVPQRLKVGDGLDQYTVTALVADTVYTLSIEGNGGIMAGGPTTDAPDPMAEHPADAAVDKTGGTVAGADCGL